MVVQGRTLVTATTIAKTEGYFPPERNEGRYSHKSDVYSYGVVSQKLVIVIATVTAL